MYTHVCTHLKVGEGIVNVGDATVSGGLCHWQGAGGLGLGQVHLELWREGEERRGRGRVKECVCERERKLSERVIER